MEVLLAHPDTWETFLVYDLIELYIKSNLLENESVSTESIIRASYVFIAQEWAAWARRGR